VSTLISLPLIFIVLYDSAVLSNVVVLFLDLAFINRPKFGLSVDLADSVKRLRLKSE